MERIILESLVIQRNFIKLINNANNRKLNNRAINEIFIIRISYERQNYNFHNSWGNNRFTDESIDFHGYPTISSTDNFFDKSPNLY